ncbi:MAG: hypothetical protein K6E46_07855, partial [Lachnospiraceae bacterium]|nr:hypothetical protein [Lachnospiraceae bacterium]
MKNNEILLDALNDIDEALIIDIDYKGQKNRRRWPYYMGALIVVIIAFILLIPYMILKNPHGAYGRLNVRAGTTISEGSEQFPSKVWFENYKAEIYREDEIIGEDSLIVDLNDSLTLPVYRNQGDVIREGIGWGISLYLTEEEINSIVDRTVKILGIKEVNRKVEKVLNFPGGKSDLFSNEIQDIVAECENDITVTVVRDGTIYIHYMKPHYVETPDAAKNADSSDSNQELIKKLNCEYQMMIGMRNSVWYYAPNEYWNESERGVYYVFEDSGSTREKVVNRYLYYAAFCVDSDNSLAQLSIHNYFCCSEYMGDYPIITLDAARQLLHDGHYYTSCEHYIKSVPI